MRNYKFYRLQLQKSHGKIIINVIKAKKDCNRQVTQTEHSKKNLFIHVSRNFKFSFYYILTSHRLL